MSNKLGIQIARCCDGMAAAVHDGHIEVCEIPEENRVAIEVPGCCGGGCNVLSELKYCPYCGKEILVNVHVDH